MKITFAALGALVIAATPTLADGLERGPFELEFEPLTGGVTMVFRPDMPRYPIVGNAVIIPTGDGVVLVDGGGGPSVTDQIIARIRSMNAGDLKYLVLTHWHSDHSLSLDRYVEAFPALRIIGHAQGDPVIEFYFDQWYREPIVGRALRQLE